MFKEIAAIIQNSDRFLIVTHVNPDGDAIGSSLGLHLSLTEMGKTSFLVYGSNPPDLFSFLTGLDEATVLADVEQLRPELIISLDAADQSRISPNIDSLRPHTRLVNIDHHPTNPSYGDINLVSANANSTASLVFQIIKATGHNPSYNASRALFTGLVTDTGCFRFEGVNSSTFRLAAEMCESGIDSYQITQYLFEEHPVQRLALERQVLNRLRLLIGGKVAISELYISDFEEAGAELSDGENLVNKLRETRGVEVGILMTRVSANLTRVSLRSKGHLDVSVIAGLFGGGGHRRAAGVKSQQDFTVLQKELLGAIEKELDKSFA